MKTWKFRMALAAVAALATVSIFATTVHAGTTEDCNEEFEDSAADDHCTLSSVEGLDIGNHTRCHIDLSCSMSISYGAEGSDGNRPTYELTFSTDGVAIKLDRVSDLDVCTTESTDTNGSVSYSGRVESSGCKTGEYTSSQVANGVFHD